MAILSNLFTTDAAVVNWWRFLCAVATLNIALWVSACARVLPAYLRQKGSSPSRTVTMQVKLLALSGLYVFGCAFRSYLPRADDTRICLYDSWLSTVFVGRTVATIAEMAFVGQWYILLSALAGDAKSRVGALSARVLLPLIAIAEVWSWYGVVTMNSIGHVLEEGIWDLCGALMTVSLLAVWPSAAPSTRKLIAPAILLGTAFVIFMSTIDVPMYFERYQAETASGMVYMDIPTGLMDISTRWVVSFEIQHWFQEIHWMSMYFSFCVWASLSFVFAPPLLHLDHAPSKSTKKLQ